MEVAATLDDLARRYVWWQTAEETRRRPHFLLCQLMQLGTLEDVQSALALVGADAFRDALRAASPGVLDAKSWTFWHHFLFKQPPPPMPERRIA